MNIFALALATVNFATAEPNYTFLPKSSTLYVTVYKDNSTLFSGMAHNHAIEAKDWIGTLEWDPENIAACRIAIDVPVEKLQVDTGTARDLAASQEPDKKIKKGFTKKISDSDKKQVRENMLSEGQLNSEKYKKISFVSKSCSKDSITGTFTMRGVSKDISIPVTVKESDKGSWNLQLKGSFPVKATEYGYKPYSLAGLVKNQDQMKIHFKVRGMKK